VRRNRSLRSCSLGGSMGRRAAAAAGAARILEDNRGSSERPRRINNRPPPRVVLPGDRAPPSLLPLPLFLSLLLVTPSGPWAKVSWLELPLWLPEGKGPRGSCVGRRSSSERARGDGGSIVATRSRPRNMFGGGGVLELLSGESIRHF
jgi:hypothetical protein